MSKIVYLNEQIGGIETLSAALGDGRTLGLNPNQLDTIKNNVIPMARFKIRLQNSVVFSLKNRK